MVYHTKTVMQGVPYSLIGYMRVSTDNAKKPAVWAWNPKPRERVTSRNASPQHPVSGNMA